MALEKSIGYKMLEGMDSILYVIGFPIEPRQAWSSDKWSIKIGRCAILLWVPTANFSHNELLSQAEDPGKLIKQAESQVSILEIPIHEAKVGQKDAYNKRPRCSSAGEPGEKNFEKPSDSLLFHIPYCTEMTCLWV